jgi:hypothetical protein
MTAAAFADDGTTAVVLVPSVSAAPAASTAGRVKANEDFIAAFSIDAGSKLLINGLVPQPTATV